MNPNYLTTLKNNSIEPEELLKIYTDSKILIAETIIEPINSKTGLLEERGIWVQSFWSEVIKSIDYINGCRFYWDSLLFCCELEHLNDFTIRYSNLLKNQSYEKVISYSVIGYSSDSNIDQKRENFFQIDEITRHIHRDINVYDFKRSINLIKLQNGLTID